MLRAQTIWFDFHQTWNTACLNIMK